MPRQLRREGDRQTGERPQSRVQEALKAKQAKDTKLSIKNKTKPKPNHDKIKTHSVIDDNDNTRTSTVSDDPRRSYVRR